MFNALRRPVELLLLLLLVTAQPAVAQDRRADGVYVVGALHGLHTREPAFDFEDLSRLIEALQPDVIVLEVRPDELAARQDTPGRPEYPAVVWPWLAGHDIDVVAMEPGGEDFVRITSAAGGQITAFQATDPDAVAYWGRLQDSLETALLAYWSGVADTQNEVTADLARALAVTEAQLVGPGFEAAQAEWDGFMVAQARAAVLAHPGKRILVLGSYRNRAGLTAGVREAAGDRLVDVEHWLRAEAFDAAALPSNR